MSCRASGALLLRSVGCRPALREDWHQGPFRHAEVARTQASMAHGYIIWRNNHVGDERLHGVTKRANLA